MNSRLTTDSVGQKRDFYSFFLDKKTSLVLHPYYIKSNNAIASFLTSVELISKVLHIMTEDSSSINIASGKELPPEIYLPYEYNQSLSKKLTTNCVILVDSLTLFRTTELASKLAGQNRKCVLIIFTSVFRSGEDDLNYFSKYYLQHGLVSYQMSSRNPGISYKLEHIPPSNKSDEKSILENGKEDKDKDPTIGYPVSDQNSVTIDTQDFPDIDKGEGGWLSEDFLSDVPTYFPKISRLLTILISQFEHHHIVYTQFKNKNGLDLLDTLLNYLSIQHTIVYGNDDHSEHMGKISTFNESDHSIILTNTIPRTEITNITHIHFLDGIEYIGYQGFINNICKNCLWKTFVPSEYVVYFYVLTPDDEKSYTDLAARIEYNENKSNELIEQSARIIFDEEKGLCIKE